jgi:ribosomal protein S18 acetylase RimI-like enzyme
MARLFSQPAQGLSPAGVFTAPGGQRFRFGPWRREPSAGHLVPLGGLVDGLSALAATDHLQGLGYKEIFTSALTLHERDPFLSLGYEVDQELTLLKRPLGLAVSPLKKPRPRPLRRSDNPQVLLIDALSFDAFWRFDAASMYEAKRATPQARQRVFCEGRQAVAYAVTGAGLTDGFIQRLAVHPDHRGQGLGSQLLDDGLRWLQRKGLAHAWVNTQPQNEPALLLYRKAGFVDCSGGLAVLKRGIHEEST